MPLVALFLASCGEPEPQPCDSDWPQLAVDPGLVVFDPVRVGEAGTAVLTVTNVGGVTTELAPRLGEEDGYRSAFSFEPEQLTLGPRESVELTVTFAPDDMGPFLAPLVLDTSGDEGTTWPEFGQHRVGLFGLGVKSQLVAEPARVDLGDVPGGETASVEVELRVEAEPSATLGDAALDSSCPSGLSLSPTWTPGAVLEVDRATLLGVRYTAADASEVACALSVSFDGGELSIPFMANGSAEPGSAQYDDDGDGYSEDDGDCDDADADASPAAVEYCDGVDGDCDGLGDGVDGCIDLSSEPVIVGGISMDRRTIVVGATTELCAIALDSDGQALSYQWAQDGELTEQGHDAIDSPVSECTVFRAPPQLPEGSEGEAYSIYVVVTDEDGNQDWEFDELYVYPEPGCLE